MQDCRVVLIGCGALGSVLAVHLCAAGVGHLTLVDPDYLSPDNVHRHVLGFESVGEPKATALASVLRARYPHLSIKGVSASVQAVLLANPEVAQSADLAISTTGEETIELLLNDTLQHFIPRIHTWLDPVGLGGHVFVIPPKPKASCYRCLFDDDPNHGLYNRASFVAQGESVSLTMAGCSGHFTPFSFQDCNQTAIYAVRKAIEVLSGEARNDSCLVSWFGNSNLAEGNGIRLSARSRQFSQDEVVESTIPKAEGCECGQWT